MVRGEFSLVMAAPNSPYLSIPFKQLLPRPSPPTTPLSLAITTTLRTAPPQGAYALYSVPLLENGVRSGMRVANSLGCQVPWSGSVGAEEDANATWVGGQGKPGKGKGGKGNMMTVGLISMVAIAAIAGMKANIRR